MAPMRATVAMDSAAALLSNRSMLNGEENFRDVRPAEHLNE